MNGFITVVGFLLLFLPGGPSTGGADPQALLIKDVRLFDGETVHEKMSVLVEEGRIVKLAQSIEPAAGTETIDGQGRTLLPGLIDSHTHTLPGTALAVSLRFGVTTNLDMFMMIGVAQHLRQEQRDGKADGRADIFSAGTLITAPGGHGTEYGLPVPTLASAEEADAFIAKRIEEGSDYIKIVYDDGAETGRSFGNFDLATLKAAIQAAQKRDKLAVVHITAREPAREALGAGANGLVHLWIDAPADKALVKLALSRKAFIIPTLTVLESACQIEGGKKLAADENLAPYLTEAGRGNLESTIPHREGSLARYETVGKSVRMLRDAGVPILAGTDTPNPGTWYGASMHRELELLVEAGLTTAEALAAATSRPADAFGLNDRGRIAVGRRADLLLVEGNPLQEIRHTRNIVGIWKRGVAVQRDLISGE